MSIDFHEHSKKIMTTRDEMTYNGFHFRKSMPTGGKAGKGNNMTTSIHVTSLPGEKPKSRYFSYRVDDPQGFYNAVRKAKKWTMKQ